MGIIGTVEVTRSFVHKITGDANPRSGMGKFETKEWFCSYKASATPDEAAAVSAELYAMAERDVMEAAYRHANFLDLPAEPVSIETPAPPQAPAPPPANTTQIGEYVVAEKPPLAPPEPQTPPAEAKAEKPSKILADRLKALGITKEELATWVSRCNPEGKRLTQEEYCTIFAEAERIIKETSVEKFRIALASLPAQPVPAQGDIFSTDPAVKSAMAQVGTKWPLWTPELVRVAALWCADQVKDAGALEAFLIANGVTDKVPPERITAFLAITRHLAMSAGAQVLEFSKKSGDPLSLIEADISKTVGQPIRFAVDLPKDAVFNAFTEKAEKLKGGKK